jgi:H-type lectin domain
VRAGTGALWSPLTRLVRAREVTSKLAALIATMDDLSFNVEDLWDAVDAIPEVARGSVQVTFTNSAALAQTVSFGRTFATPPFVITNIMSGDSTTIRWMSTASSVTTTGFGLRLVSTNNVATSWPSPGFPVQWLAIGL